MYFLKINLLIRLSSNGLENLGYIDYSLSMCGATFGVRKERYPYG